MNLSEMIDMDLPSFQSIRLAQCTLGGISDDLSCSLILRSKIELI